MTYFPLKISFISALGSAFFRIRSLVQRCVTGPNKDSKIVCDAGKRQPPVKELSPKRSNFHSMIYMIYIYVSCTISPYKSLSFLFLFLFFLLKFLVLTILPRTLTVKQKFKQKIQPILQGRILHETCISSISRLCGIYCEILIFS